MASDVLIHTNCTTGVEAFALDKPAISLQPTVLAVNDVYLANHINYVTATVDETLAQLDRLIGPGVRLARLSRRVPRDLRSLLRGHPRPLRLRAYPETLQQELGLSCRPRAFRRWRLWPGYRRRRARASITSRSCRRSTRHGEQVLRSFDRAFGRAALPCRTLRPAGIPPARRGDARAHELPGDFSAWLQRLWPKPRGIGIAPPNPH